MSHTLRHFVVRFASIALISMGFMQAGWAGMVGTGYLIESEGRAASLERLEELLAHETVAEQLLALGVEPDAVAERLQGMTYAELQAIEGQLDSQIAGGDALGIIGAVFLVLLILELVGVTDIFKSI